MKDSTQINSNQVIVTNDLYPYYTGTDVPTKYGRFLLTDGVADIAKETESYWLLDVIISYQSELKLERFQCWTLTREMEVGENGEVLNRTNVFTIVCDNGNETVLRRQKFPFTDFKHDKYIIWLINQVLLLPREY